MKPPYCGHPISEETKRKISEANRGKIWTPEEKLKISGENNHYFGKHHADEWKKMMSLKFKGRRSPMLGRHLSPETRQKMSIAHAGPRAFFYGKTLPPETRAKIGKASFLRWQTEEFRQKLIGENHHAWKGGSHLINGYIFNYQSPKKYRAAHRVIAEAAIGRPLKSHEAVHHINGKRIDNRNENLLICTRSYHTWLERKIKRFEQRRVSGSHFNLHEQDKAGA